MVTDGGSPKLLHAVIEDGEIRGKGFSAVDFKKNTKGLKLVSCDKGIVIIRDLTRQELQEASEMFRNELEVEHLFVADIECTVVAVTR